MFQAFVIVLREGFEAFLIVSIIVSYMRKMGHNWLLPAVYWGLVTSVIASGVGGFWMSKGINEPFWEGTLGLVAAVMVTTLVIQMWRQGRFVKQNMESRLGRITLQHSKRLVFLGVFLFTVFMITREGMETALMLIQVPQGKVIAGVLLGLLATAGFSVLWVRFSSLINVKLFFQVTGIFLLLFVSQILIYSFHEFAEAGMLPNSEAFHLATEPLSPTGIYGKWFSFITVSVCAAWLLGAWAAKKLRPAAHFSSEDTMEKVTEEGSLTHAER